MQPALDALRVTTAEAFRQLAADPPPGGLPEPETKNPGRSRGLVV